MLKKISRREKIIVVCMALAIGYGVYQLFLAPAAKVYFPETGKNVDISKLHTVLVEVTREIDLGDPSAVEEYSVSRAEEAKMWGWQGDPFLDDPVSFVPGMAVRVEEAVIQSSFTYSGYIDVEGRRMAIIDGLEYQVGEKMATGNHVLREIYPEKVVLEIVFDHEGTSASVAEQAGIKIIVPLVEW